jgi:hypothetical protein
MPDAAPSPFPVEPSRGRRPRRSPPRPTVTRRTRPTAKRVPVPKPTRTSGATGTPKLLTAIRFVGPFLGPTYEVLAELAASMVRKSDMARRIEQRSLDYRLERTIHPDAGGQRGHRASVHSVKPIARVKPVAKAQPNPLTRVEPVTRPSEVSKVSTAAKPALEPQPVQLPKVEPGSRPFSRSLPVAKAAPRFEVNFEKFFQIAPRGPLLDNPLLTRFKSPSVKSPLTLPNPGNQVGLVQLPSASPFAQPQANPRTDKCRCPKPKKLKSGRGFFVVSPSGLERRKYWKTGKDHNKEYRNARNTSRDFRRSGRKQLKSILGFSL